MIKPVDFFKGDKIKEVDDKRDWWQKIKEKKCIVLARRIRGLYHKYAYAKYDTGYMTKYILIVYNEDKNELYIVEESLGKVYDSYKNQYFSHVDKELKELMVLEGI